MAKYTGTGAVVSADFQDVKWVGKTKDGNACTIKLKNAINLGNIDWALAEKDDVVAALEFEACYDNTDAQANSTTEPWEVETTGAAGAAGILLGLGVFYVGETAVGLCRGGGRFTVEREYRKINADGDRGGVKDRVVMEGSIAKLTMNTLTVLNRLADFYPGISTLGA